MRKLTLNAELILAIPSVTAGTSWELEWVAINENLRNTVFLMPPAIFAHDNVGTSWSDDWPKLQRWARFMGLSFPDYDPAGLFFTMEPDGAVLRSIRFAEWLTKKGQWWNRLIRLTGATTDWLSDVQRGSLAYAELKDAETRGVDWFTLADEVEDERREKIRSHLVALGTDQDLRFLPILERLDTVIEGSGLWHGTKPGLRFADWKIVDTSVYDLPGVFTIWWGTKDLLWAGFAAHLRHELERIASGDVSGSDFCGAVLSELILPSLNPEMLSDLEAGLIDATRMTQFFIHRHLSVLVKATPQVEDGARIAHLIAAGVLSLGGPRLRPAQ